MESSFTTWLSRELDERGWSQSEAARRGQISGTMISMVLSEQARPGLDFMRGIARAFNIPLEDVFRLAGVLPPRVVSEGRVRYQVGGDDEVRLVQLYRELPEDEQGLVMELIERLTGRVVARIVGATDENR